jgi:hypothetical protein
LDYEIRPKPDDAEREAILAALVAEPADEQPLTPWVRAALPVRDGEAEEP